MPSQFTIQESIRKIETASSHEEQLYMVLEVYMDLFPVKDSHLLRYSPLGYLGEGIVAFTTSGFTQIRDLRDDIRSLPIIYKAIRERKAKFCSGIEHFINVSSKYILPSPINCLLVVPICFGSVTIGYICTSEFEKGTLIDQHVLPSYTLYGKLVGKALENFHSSEDPVFLSKREMEVMRRISWGESTKIMAVSMAIGEATVKQYVKSAINKLNAQNRTQAVAELFRRGLLA
ncbi:response regulator transcription factor [Alkalihalobacillus deserti]|uniref:response regulator transcription factor n=1 Tax=Alkalihalobacillus deserti TaxID=2879466 RepID=UPI001D14BFDF|nr:LuxR C-terminal-related transcriptional regulator [Alkalihalobacillus deserti]